MCLAIPGRIVEHVDEANQLAKVEVAGVRRTVNIGLLGDVGPGDWVLIHVGFAISKVDEEEARATRDLLEGMGADYEAELEELDVRATDLADGERRIDAFLDRYLKARRLPKNNRRSRAINGRLAAHREATKRRGELAPRPDVPAAPKRPNIV